MGRYKIIIFFELFFLTMMFQGCMRLLPKGPARWSQTHSSEESIERGVFFSYYDVIPFHYKDSVCDINLIIKEAYAEYWHWFDKKITSGNMRMKNIWLWFLILYNQIWG